MIRILATCLLPTLASASILGYEFRTVVFHPDSTFAGDSWSPNLVLTEAGLESGEYGSNQVKDAWFQSGAMSVGLSWRCPASGRLELTVFGTGTDSLGCGAWCRYGCDRVHWSTWHSLPAAEPVPGGIARFGYSLTLPEVAVLRYRELMHDWYATDPNWSSDEHAFCVWLGQEHPGFFETEFPFMGYVQFRLEHWSMPFGVVIDSVRCGVSYGMSGLATIPKDGGDPYIDEKWFFDLREPGTEK